MGSGRALWLEDSRHTCHPLTVCQRRLFRAVFIVMKTLQMWLRFDKCGGQDLLPALRPEPPLTAGGPSTLVMCQALRSSVSLPVWQAMASELQAQKSLLGEVEQNLQVAKQCSNSMASRFQEHCPDLERQEAEVHKLNQRFNHLSQQVERR